MTPPVVVPVMCHKNLCNRKALRRSPRRAEIGRRARFFCDDLLELFSFQGRAGRAILVCASNSLFRVLSLGLRSHFAVARVTVTALAEVTLLIAGLENPAVL